MYATAQSVLECGEATTLPMRCLVVRGIVFALPVPGTIPLFRVRVALRAGRAPQAVRTYLVSPTGRVLKVRYYRRHTF